jgi:glycosyltransferase involved in cell wall biosynthesis
MNLDLVICSTLSQSGGGRETWLYNFLFEWAKRFKDTNVRIYSLKKSDDNVVKNIKLSFPNIKIESHEVLLSHSFIPKGFAFALNIKNLYNTNTNNHNVIVAVGGLHEILACAFIKLRLSIDSKMILWLRSIYVHEKYDKIPNFLRPIISSIEIYFIRNFFSLVIANGKDTYEYYYKKNIDAYVIPNSIPLIKYNNIVKLPSKKLRIAYIGRLSKVKGICEFIESIKISAKLDFFFDMSFHVIGDGPFREEVENIAHQGLLQYHGAIPNIEMPEILKKIGRGWCI